MNLPVGDVLLELGEGRARVRAVEATEGHDRRATTELQARSVLGTGSGSHPGVVRGILLECLRHGAARSGRVEQAAHAAVSSVRRTALGLCVATIGLGIAARTLNELRPSTRTDNAMSHRDAGGLSTVMAFEASELP